MKIEQGHLPPGFGYKLVTEHRKADLYCDVTAPLAGEFADWPQNIKDGIYKALERFNAMKQAKFEIDVVRCSNDGERWFIHVTARTASELVSRILLPPVSDRLQ